MTLTMNKDVQRRYTTAISKGAGMTEETRRLLEHWTPGESLDGFMLRVQDQGLLGNATAYRTRDVVRRVFAPRYLKPTDKPARILQRVLSSGLPGRVFRELLFLFTARQDPLVYDFTIREYWPAARRGRNVVGTDSMLSFLSEAHYDGRLDNQWSESVSVRIAPAVVPNLFPSTDTFRDWMKVEEIKTVRDLAQEMIDVCRWKTGYENILLLIDEAGQYVAPRGELILNLQGLSQNFKELGKGKVWIAATGQQTLSEIVDKAAHNSAELNKLMARFPISIRLDASDIREITHRRLLDKSEEGRKRPDIEFREHCQSTVTHTRLTGTALFNGDPDAETFVRLYPFLPQHFDLLLELIRTLARSTAGLENIKEVRASVKLGRTSVVGGSEDVEVRLEFVEQALWDGRRKEFLVSTNSQVELKNTVVLLIRNEEAVEELLPEIVKSEKVLGDVDERSADHVVAQYLRAERRSAERSRERAAAAMEKAMMDGVFIFRGKPTPVREAGETLDAAVRNILSSAVEEVFPHFHLAPIRPATDAAAKFLGVERMDRITKDLDPLGLVTKSRGAPRIDTATPVSAEVLRVFRAKSAESGSGRLQGSYLQDVFSAPPYGWTKDTVRYLFAALLRAGEIEFHVPGAEGAIR